jgi:hypothetical protein
MAMADFSIGKAIGAGFRLIRRKPLAPLVWGLIYTPLLATPAMLGLLMPPQGVRHGDLDPDAVGAMMLQMAPLVALQPIIMLSSIVVQAMLYCAVFRAVLEPQNDRRFYLRLSAQELWVGLTQFALGFVLMIPMLLGIGVYAASGGGKAAIAPLIGLGAVGLFGLTALVLWVYARFSMAAPMSFEDRTFRLLESWPFTRGKAGKLMLLGCFVFGVAIGFWVILMIPIALLVGLAAVGAALAAAFGAGGNSAGVGPAAVVLFMVLLGVFSGYMWAVTLAPWADAYRQMRQAPGSEPPPLST